MCNGGLNNNRKKKRRREEGDEDKEKEARVFYGTGKGAIISRKKIFYDLGLVVWLRTPQLWSLTLFFRHTRE